MMDFDSIFNISIGSEDENFDSDQQPNEGSTENSEYAAAQSDSSLYASLESDVDNTEESLNVSCRHIYTRDELVECSLSLICLQPPPNWEIAKRRMPEIVLQEPRKKTKVKPPKLEQHPWHMDNLAKRNECAWKKAYMADCTLVVGEDKKEFQCHKYFLCLASPVLEDALKDSEENPKIFLPNISSLNFYPVLEYIYTDKIKKKNLVTIKSAWIVARELGIISLEQYCVTCARQKMCGSNVCSILQFARLINDEEFELFCTQYIQENTSNVLYVTDWYKIEQRTLETILSLEVMLDTSEVDLFKVCVKWANVNTPLFDGNKRDTLGPLIGLIRFLAIKVEDFALTVCPTKILTPEEMVAIFCCLVTGARGMPAGFSIESSPRDRAVSSDIVQASTSNVTSCDSEVPSLVQTEQVELSESSAVGNDKSSFDVLLNQELAPPIQSTENSQFQMGREDVISLPFGDNKNILIRDGGQIMQHPLSFSVSSMAFILGFDLISWRKDESAYYENLQVTLKTQAGTKVVAKFEGSLKRLQRFQVDFDNPVLVFPDTIYKELGKNKSSLLEDQSWRKEKMAKRNAFALKKAFMADCSLVIGEEEKEFPCHKYFLCLASAVLEDALKDTEENHKIFLPDIDSASFQKVLEYIYKNKIKNRNFAVIQSIWITANKLGIISLEHYCVAYARRQVCVASACSTLQFARLINDEDFEQFCIQYIQENAAKVLQATNWCKIEQRTLETILSFKVMHDTSEVDLFKACVKWANENTPPGGNKRDTLKPLFGLIRFLAFKVEDFALTVYPTKILNPEEMVAIFYCLVTGARDMPTGFSIKSSPRDRAVSSDIFQASTSNASSCDSEVPSLVQTEQVELRDFSEMESSSLVSNDKVTEVLLNQELATPISPTANCLFQMGRTHAIKIPLDTKHMPIRNGEQILQSPLAFSVNSVACILGIQLIP